MRRRGREEIPDEIREEISFHLDMRTRDNLARGMTPEAAREDAERRFGDPERVAGLCLAEWNREEEMLQKVNLGLLVAVLVSALALAGLSRVVQRDTAGEISRLGAEVGALREALVAGRPAFHDPARAISVYGQVARPGALDYRDGLTLTLAVAECGGPSLGAKLGSVRIVRRDGPAFEIDLLRILGGEEKDVDLRPGDVVRVPEAFF